MAVTDPNSMCAHLQIAQRDFKIAQVDKIARNEDVYYYMYFHWQNLLQ